MKSVELKEVEHRIDRLKATCKEAGFKLTHQPIEIFREVAESLDHPDAESVYKNVRKQLPTISLDTVYRTLKTLTDLGLITTLNVRYESMRFDANPGHHHHLTCIG